MPIRLWSVVFDANDRVALARFWAEAVGWTYSEEEEYGEKYSAVTTADGTLRRIEFVSEPSEKRFKNRIHFDLTNPTMDDVRSDVDRLIGLGARHVDIGQGAETDNFVLADPEGNEFCVIEAGNKFLADTAFLGELASDGTRAVGYFWSKAVDWPLVWDQDEETAIQAPTGGPKVAWGGGPVAPKPPKNRMHFDLTLAAGDDVDAEVERLLALGATRLESGQEADAVPLADPDGNEFYVLTAPRE